MHFEIDHRRAKKEFAAMNGQEEAGKITYTEGGTDKIIIDHTEVDKNYGGQGVGKKLILAAVEAARSEGFKIIPLCPFAKSVFDKDPSLEDVLFKS